MAFFEASKVPIGDGDFVNVGKEYIPNRSSSPLREFNLESDLSKRGRRSPSPRFESTSPRFEPTSPIFEPTFLKTKQVRFNLPIGEGEVSFPGIDAWNDTEKTSAINAVNSLQDLIQNVTRGNDTQKQSDSLRASLLSYMEFLNYLAESRLPDRVGSLKARGICLVILAGVVCVAFSFRVVQHLSPVFILVSRQFSLALYSYSPSHLWLRWVS